MKKQNIHSFLDYVKQAAFFLGSIIIKVVIQIALEHVILLIITPNYSVTFSTYHISCILLFSFIEIWRAVSKTG